MAKFGGNTFTTFSVPLVFEGRYFLFEPGDPPMLTVILDRDGEPVVEVLRNEPQPNDVTDVTKTPVGIVTVAEDGTFVYKVRPGSETSVVFGTLSGEEIDVNITDRNIRVGTSVFENNTFDGVMAGVVVRPDGGTVMGALLPEQVVAWLTQ